MIAYVLLVSSGCSVCSCVSGVTAERQHLSAVMAHDNSNITQSHSSIVGESCSWNSFVNEIVKMDGVTHRSRLCFAMNTNDIPPWIVDLDLLITYKWIENILVYKFLYGFIALYQHTTNYWVFDYCLGSAWLFYCKFISVPCSDDWSLNRQAMFWCMWVWSM